MTKDQLFGSWKVLSFKAIAGNDISYPLGPEPGGYIGFSPTRFWVMLADSTRKPPVSAALTDAEAISLMRSCVAYTGMYELESPPTAEGSKIAICVDAASNQALVGTDRIFFLRLNGNELTFQSPSVVIPNGSRSTVQLNFIKAD